MYITSVKDGRRYWVSPTLVRKLKENGFTYEDYERAQIRWLKRGMTFGYGGRGRYSGMFSVSGCFGGGLWKSYRSPSPERMINEVATLYREFQQQ